MVGFSGMIRRKIAIIARRPQGSIEHSDLKERFPKVTQLKTKH
jgi:hypothetical protein